jgi:hypothetical protein
MGKATPGLVVTSLIAVALVGCGAGSSSTGSDGANERDRGVGQSAPISKAIVARRTRPWHGRPAGRETIGARPCMPQEGRGEIGIYTDLPAPGCVRITGRQRLTIVNRTSAFRRSEGRPIFVRLGPYSARLLPQQAALFGKVGRFLGRGFHDAKINNSVRVGVLVLPNDCALLRPEPGEPACFKKDRRAIAR